MAAGKLKLLTIFLAQQLAEHRCICEYKMLQKILIIGRRMLSLILGREIQKRGMISFQ